MKYSTATLLTFGAAVMAQDLAGLPKCGQTCVGNMLAIAQSQFGCKAGDVVCYCTNVNFGYGMRDCSNQACSKEDAATVIQFGTAYCQAALQGVSTASGAASALTVLSSAAASVTASGSGASASGAASSTPVTTTPLVATITSGDSTIVSTTGFATIYGAVTGAAASAASSVTGSAASAASSAASGASSGASSVASAASSAASSAAGSASSAASSIAASASSRASSATGGAQSSSSSAGAGPMKTAAPMLGVAAMGALLFI